MFIARLVALVLCTACGAAVVAPDASASSEQAVDSTCLDHADAADGAVDKVIHRCANCGLGMDGKAEFVSTIDGYAAHNCSAHCKEALDANPAAVLGRSCKK
jgi:YHS domain-containing protein